MTLEKHAEIWDSIFSRINRLEEARERADVPDEDESGPTEGQWAEREQF